MYLANNVRPDLAYVIGMHCRNMSSPTPKLLRELDHVFVYLALAIPQWALHTILLLLIYMASPMPPLTLVGLPLAT